MRGPFPLAGAAFLEALLRQSSVAMKKVVFGEKGE